MTGQDLRNIREESSLSMGEFSAFLLITKSRLQQLENGAGVVGDGVAKRALELRTALDNASLAALNSVDFDLSRRFPNGIVSAAA